MPPECPTCFLTAHDGPCTRDPAEVKAEKFRRLRMENQLLRARLAAMAEAHPFDMDGSESAMTAAWFVGEAQRALAIRT